MHNRIEGVLKYTYIHIYLPYILLFISLMYGLQYKDVYVLYVEYLHMYVGMYV